MKTYTESELNEVLRLHKLWLSGDIAGIKADLSGSDLSGSNLRYSDLRYSDLRYSNLRGSNLHGSNLRHSDLRHSDLSYSNLSHSNLRGSDLSNSNLSNSNLSGSNLSNSNLRGSSLSDSDLSDSDLSYSIGFVYIGQRTDGYIYYAQYNGSEWVIKAGCRSLTIQEYRLHTLSYSCDIKRQETNDLLDFAEKRIKLLGRVEQ